MWDYVQGGLVRPRSWDSGVLDHQRTGGITGLGGGRASLVAGGKDTKGFFRGEPDGRVVGVVAAGMGQTASRRPRTVSDSPAAGIVADGVGRVQDFIQRGREQGGLAGGSAQLVGGESGVVFQTGVDPSGGTEGRRVVTTGSVDRKGLAFGIVRPGLVFFTFGARRALPGGDFQGPEETFFQQGFPSLAVEFFREVTGNGVADIAV